MTTPDQVKQNFRVVGEQMNGNALITVLNYDKFKTKTLLPVILQISNSSNQFGIQFFPTGSTVSGNSTRLTYTTLEEPPVNITKAIPYTLPSGSAIKVQVTVDTTNFDTKTDNTQELCEVVFNLVAVTSSFASIPIPQQTLPTWTPSTGTPPGNDGNECDIYLQNCPTGFVCQLVQTGTTSTFANVPILRLKCVSNDTPPPPPPPPQPPDDSVCGCVDGRCSSSCSNNGDYCESDSWCSS